MEIHTICLNWSILRKKNNWLLRGKELSLGVGMQKRNIYNWNKRWEIKHIWEKLMVPEPRIILWGHCAFCFLFLHSYLVTLGFPGGSNGKESACSAGDMGLIPGSGRSPGEGNDNPLQYSCLKNHMDRGAWWTAVQRVAESDRTEELSTAHSELLSIKFTWLYCPAFWKYKDTIFLKNK